MASFGPTDLQNAIQAEFTNLFTAIIANPEAAPEIERIFLGKLEDILRGAAEIQATLTLNETCTIEKVNYPVQALINNLKLNIVKIGLARLAAQYQATYQHPDEEIALKRADPSHLKQFGETLVDLETGEQYPLTLKLQGRGQPGLANFYQGPDGFERLIKEDDVGTCLMEGTAYYIQEAGLLPGTLGNSVNFAKVGTLQIPDVAKPAVISIQDRVKPSQPDGKVRAWDELVYGVKRNPKTLMSFEAWYPQAIKENVLLLNTTPKWQLAAGIVSSAIAGDESLHVGQFMATLDSRGEIDGIKRIDLGARERYAVARNDASQHDPFNASSFYVKSGQFGKNYVSYLLAEPSLHKMYTMLWMNISAIDDVQQLVMQQSKHAFLKQFSTIPEPLQKEALSKVLETINKSTKKPFVLDSRAPLAEQAESVALKLAELDALRVINMAAKSRMAYAEYQGKTTSRITSLLPSEQRGLCVECLRLHEKLILSRALNADILPISLEKVEVLNGLIGDLVKQASQSPSPEIFERIQLLTELGSDLLHAMTLNLQYNPEMLQKFNSPVNEHLNKLQTLNELATYCLETSSQDKKNLATMMMVKTLASQEEFLSYIKNPALIDALKTHQSFVSSSLSSAVTKVHTRGELLLTRLFKRFHQDDRLLMMSQNQHDLIADIKAGRFQKVATDLNKLSIMDMLTPDQEGETALHYLMARANDEHSMKAICTILSKSIGATLNSNLNIPNTAGQTPLDLLMANPNAKDIVAFVAAQNIKGYYGGQYLLKDFFDIENHNPDYKAVLAVPSAAPSKSWW